MTSQPPVTLARFALLHDPDHVRTKFAEASRLVPEAVCGAADRMTIPAGHSRFVKSHLPMSLNPPDLLQKAKVMEAAAVRGYLTYVETSHQM